jgi:O-antigen/teichoic acid export membrane protein
VNNPPDIKEKIIPVIKQSAIYSLRSFIGPFTSIFMAPIYTRIFVPDDYGVINLIQIVIFFMTPLLILGTDNATGRYYNDPESEQDRELTASTSMLFRAVMVFSGFLVFVLFSKQISLLLFKTSIYTKCLIIAVAAVPFQQCAGLCLLLLRFNFRAFTFVIFSLARLFATLSLTILFVVLLRWGIMGIFEAALLISILFFLIIVFTTKGYFSFKFSIKRLRELLKYGIPLVPYSFTVYLIYNCDRYFLSYFCTLKDVGLYGIGSQIAGILMMLFTGFGLAWSPFFFSTYKEDNIKPVYSKVMDYLISATFFLIICASLFAAEVLIILTTPQYYEAHIVVPILALFFAFYHLGLYMSFGIHIAKKTIHFTWVGAVTAAVNMGLNFLLVPSYGMIGAAIATLACSIVWCVLLVFVSQKYYYINYNLSSFLKILAASSIIICISYLLPPSITLANTLIKLGMLGGFVVCLYLFNLIGIDELKYSQNLGYKLLAWVASRVKREAVC